MDETTPDEGQLEHPDDNDLSGAGGGQHRVRPWPVIVTVVVLVGLATAIGVVVARRSGTNEQVSTATTVTPTPSTTAAPTTMASTTTAPTAAAPAADAGTWSLVPEGPNHVGRPVAWTGKEVLVARGGCCGDLGSDDLSAYDPVANTWRQLPSTPLTSRNSSAGAWTGTEMILAGGVASPDGTHQYAARAVDGAAWNAATNAWHPIAPMPTPFAASDSVWTGQELLAWSSDPDLVLAYNPSTDRWRSLPPSGLAARHDPVAVWTGTELVVWGGFNSDTTAAYSDGARLDPATGTWRPLPTAPVPARGGAAAAWSGHEVLLWGGDTAIGGQNQGIVGQGAAYDPTTNTWRALPLSPLRAKSWPAGVWTGRFFIVIGGGAGSTMPVPGPGTAAYDPSTDTWTTLPTAPPYPLPAPNGATGPADQRLGGLTVWTGTAVVLVGGGDLVIQGTRSDGLTWTPAS